MKLESHAPMRLVERSHPALHEPAAPVDRVDVGTSNLLADMAHFMREQGGCGLAAPQVGVPYRLIVVDAGNGLIKAANPTIVDRQGGVLSLEGCLSVKGSLSVVWRASQVTVQATDQDGRPFTRLCKGLEARCFQHEIDHLDGKLMTDRALFTVTPLRALGGVAGTIAGAVTRGVSGAIVGGVAGVALAWSAEKAFGWA